MSQKIRTISLSDNEYPRLLREIPHPPQTVNVWGELPKTKHYLSIVGTRKCSAYGEEMTKRIISGLVGYDFTIVSGLASGIDTVTHMASIMNSIPTVAVLGSGLSTRVLYPSKNISLAEEIVRTGGAVISEYDFEMKAAQWSFPQRNRIISGLSSATLVVEAPLKSGSLVTARFALDQNRDVAAVPGNALIENAKGTHALIKQGAALIETPEDILRIYNIETGQTEEKIFDLSKEERMILECLSEPLDIDSLIRKSKLPAHIAQYTIGLMEIRGIIKKLGTEYVKTSL